jgi:hypothetical protein
MDWYARRQKIVRSAPGPESQGFRMSLIVRLERPKCV